MTWRDRAACAGGDHEMFFPSSTNSTRPSPYGTLTPARRVCCRCPVWQECLDFAIVNDLDCGVWGGASSGERRQIGRRRMCRGDVRVRLDRLAARMDFEERR